MTKRFSFIFVVIGILVLHVGLAALLPLMTDEAYYLQWARFPDWGYFDHPPMIAWMNWALNFSFLPDPISARVGPLLVSLLTLPIFVALLKEAGLKNNNVILIGLLALHCSLAGLLFASLNTPDVLLVLFWMSSLWAALKALHGKNHYWLVAGIFAGLGLLAKYMMVIILPVFVIAVALIDRQHFRRGWFYGGAVAAMLVFAPHIIWNANNNWVTMGFQIQHGLVGSHAVEIPYGTDLPLPTKLDQTDSIEQQMRTYFHDPLFADKPRIKRTEWEKAKRRIRNYVSSQFGIWGFYNVIFMWIAGSLLLCVIRKNNFNLPFGWQNLTPQALRLLLCATFVPLAVFLVIAFRTSVEANWPAFYIISAAVILIPAFSHYQKLFLVTTSCNIILLALLGFAIQTSDNRTAISDWLAPQSNRVLKEAHGFKEIPAKLKEITQSKNIFVESYQSAAMIRFYAPDWNVEQWPGLTRRSEFTRAARWYQSSFEKIKSKKSFWLLTQNNLPFRISDFRISNHYEVRDCLQTGIHITKLDFSKSFDPPCGNLSIKRWFLSEYQMH